MTADYSKGRCTANVSVVRKCPQCVVPSERNTFCTARVAVLLEAALVNRAQLRRHLVALFEVLGVERAAAHRAAVRHAAELERLDARRHRERQRRSQPRRPLHEVGPDRQRDGRGVGLAANRRRLIAVPPRRRRPRSSRSRRTRHRDSRWSCRSCRRPGRRRRVPAPRVPVPRSITSRSIDVIWNATCLRHEPPAVDGGGSTSSRRWRRTR